MKFLINNQLGYFDISNNIWLQGLKNYILHNLCLPLLTKGKCIIDNVPQIKDIELNLRYLAELGAKIKWLSPTTVSIQCENINNKLLSPALSRKTTGSKFFIPLMVNLFGEYKTGACGGCNIGDRQFEKYAQSLESFGIKHEKLDNEIYRFFQSELVVKEYKLPFPSFGLTVNAILSSVWRTEDITINNACQEPEIDNTIEILRLMGKDIDGQKPDTQYFESGAVLTKLSLAVNRRTSKKDSEPDWFAVEIWGNIAEVAANYTDKGSLIGIQGELKFDEWTAQVTGQQRVKPVIRANNLELLGSNPNSNSLANSPNSSDQTNSQQSDF